MGNLLAQALTEDTANKLLEQLKEAGLASPRPESLEVWSYFFVLIIAGAFGGFVGELDAETHYRLHPWGRPAEGKPIELGWLGGVLIGIAAAIGIMLVGDTFGVLRGKTADGFHWMRLAALGIIAGFTGRSLLSGLAQKVTDIAKKQVDKQAQVLKTEIKEEGEKILAAIEALNEADRLLEKGDCHRAMIAYESVEQKFPEQRLRAQKGVANCLAYLGKSGASDQPLHDADKLLERLDAEFPNNPDIAYNWMWVRVLIHERDLQRQRPPTYTVEQLRSALKRAIDLDPESKRWAKFQTDLRPLLVREPTIAELVGGPPAPAAAYKWRTGEGFYHLPTCPLAQQGEGWTNVAEPPLGTAPCRNCLP